MTIFKGIFISSVAGGISIGTIGVFGSNKIY
jgi:hypothetical protein